MKTLYVAVIALAFIATVPAGLSQQPTPAPAPCPPAPKPSPKPKPVCPLPTTPMGDSCSID